MLQWASKIDREREMNQWQKSGMWIVGMLGTLLLIAGCASKEDKALFEKIQRQSPELRTLQQSEKAIFDAGDENETIVIATHDPLFFNLDITDREIELRDGKIVDSEE